MNNVRLSKSGIRLCGFTVVELLVALVVTSIVLGAAGTLSYAVGRAIDSTEKLNHSQRSLRYATLRIGELVRHGKLVMTIPTNGIAVWTSDENEDGMINGSELVYIEEYAPVVAIRQLRMVEFIGQNHAVTIAEITDGSARTTLLNMTDERVATILEDATEVLFTLDFASQYVVVQFSLDIDSVSTEFEVRAMAGASADNLIDQGTGELVTGDDD